MSVPPQTMYLDPTDENARRLLKRGIEGTLLMLNLLRFREIADYSDFPDLAQPESVSRGAADDRYVRHTLPLLAPSGGSVEKTSAACTFPWSRSVYAEIDASGTNVTFSIPYCFFSAEATSFRSRRSPLPNSNRNSRRYEDSSISRCAIACRTRARR